MTEPTRIVLMERAPRCDYAVAFEADSFVVQGVPLLPNRRVSLRDVVGLERSGAWLWVGAGFVPVVLGGEDAPVERLARVEAELRARIGALPGGAGRLVRLDARRALRLHRPWLTAALVLGLGVASGAAGVFGLRAATDLLLLLAIGLIAEPSLGAARLLASGCAALLAAGFIAPGDAWQGLAPLALALGWAGLLACVRVRRERVLSVRSRSTLDAGLLLVPLLAIHALSVGVAAPVLAAAALAGALVTLLLLRGWPEGVSPRAR